MKLVLGLTLGLGVALAARAQTSTFTYQGRLHDAGGPASGLYDLRFRLFDAAINGGAVGGPLTNAAVAVSNGLFVATLDFGAAAFSGADRWLEIGVRTNGGGAFADLSPRQAVRPTPYAITAGNVTAGAAVQSLNTLKNNVTLAAGANVTITPSGNTLTIASSGGGGVWSLNGPNAFFNGGDVGIGTASPIENLHVRGSDARLRLESTDSSNYSETQYYANGRIWNTGVGGATTPTANKYFIFDGTAFQFRMVLDTSGNMGIGTITPASKLDVRGSIRLGADGQHFATGGEEDLRIMRGQVTFDAAAPVGCCFSVTRPFTGTYDITFSTAFSGTPTVTATASSSAITTAVIAPTATGVRITTYYGTDAANTGFHFIAVGPR